MKKDYLIQKTEMYLKQMSPQMIVGWVKHLKEPELVGLYTFLKDICD